MTTRAARLRAVIKKWAVPLAVVWTLATLAGLFLPGSHLPDSSLLQADKAVHFAIFAFFGGFWMIALGDTLPRATLYILTLGLAYGILTEVGQSLLTGGREGDPLDALANAAGLATGVLAFRIWRMLHPIQTEATSEGGSVSNT